jgi:2-keto-4-pentenoate hydratase/2-oxohepta-3-ene-1,7-dioic acid hydratase in catechol pathway
MSPSWTNLVKFISEEDGQTHLGQVDSKTYPDVGLAVLNGEKIAVKLVKGTIFDGVVTDTTMHIARVRILSSPNPFPSPSTANRFKQLLAPIGIEEVPIIRCMGLNYRDHAKEANMPIPDVPVLFIKPRTALNGPHPAKINVPKFAQDGSSDYEAELSIILSKSGRDIPESEAMDYVLGYTCSNDVSARTQQFKNSQWCFSKGKNGITWGSFILYVTNAETGLDGSCPLGPVLVSSAAIGNPHNLSIKAIHNGSVVQDSNTK